MIREAEGGRMVAGLGIGGNDMESMFVVVRLFCIGLCRVVGMSLRVAILQQERAH